MALKDSLLTPNDPHFSMLIQHSDLYQGKLMIPEKFVRKYGSNLQSPVKLKVCSGAVWKVGLEKSDGVVWLESGLKEFMAYYSILGKQFLVFKYKKNSEFEVTIIDASGTEIEYKCASRNDESSQEKNEDFEKNSLSFELADEGLPCKKRKGKLPTDCLRTDSSDKTGESSKRGQSSSQGLEGKLNAKGPNEGEEARTSLKSPENENHMSMRKVLEKELAECLERVNAFESDKPFFKVIMRSSYVSRSLVLPVTFARKYLIELRGTITLQLSDGRTWLVKYHRQASKATPNAQLDGGWRDFVRDNHLNVGDVCVFEVNERRGILLKVVIFRIDEAKSSPDSSGIPDYFTAEDYESDQLPEADENGNGGSSGWNCCRSPSCSRISKCLKAANKFTSRNPFVKMVVRDSYLKPNGTMYLPLNFLRNLIEPKNQNVALQFAGRSWHMRMNYRSDRARFILCGGWKTFAQENSLRVGDVCVFELLNKDDVLLKVSLFRHY